METQGLNRLHRYEGFQCSPVGGTVGGTCHTRWGNRVGRVHIAQRAQPLPQGLIDVPWPWWVPENPGPAHPTAAWGPFTLLSVCPSTTSNRSGGTPGAERKICSLLIPMHVGASHRRARRPSLWMARGGRGTGARHAATFLTQPRASLPPSLPSAARTQATKAPPFAYPPDQSFSDQVGIYCFCCCRTLQSAPSH